MYTKEITCFEIAVAQCNGAPSTGSVLNVSLGLIVTIPFPTHDIIKHLNRVLLPPQIAERAVARNSPRRSTPSLAH